MSNSCLHTPAAPLSAFIHCFWYWESDPQPHAKKNSCQTAEPAIIFNLRDQPIRIYDPADLNKYQSYGRAVLSGARSDCFVIDTDQQERVLGIQFRAGGAFPFFAMPASEAEGLSIDLEDLWPTRARVIRDQLLNACSVSAMFQLLERHLLEHLVRPLELHSAIGYALREFQRPNHDGNRLCHWPDRFEFAPLCGTLPPASRTHAEGVLPRSALPTRSENLARSERPRMGRLSAFVRLL